MLKIYRIIVKLLMGEDLTNQKREDKEGTVKFLVVWRLKLKFDKTERERQR